MVASSEWRELAQFKGLEECKYHNNSKKCILGVWKSTFNHNGVTSQNHKDGCL